LRSKELQWNVFVGGFSLLDGARSLMMHIQFRSLVTLILLGCAPAFGAETPGDGDIAKPAPAQAKTGEKPAAKAKTTEAKAEGSKTDRPAAKLGKTGSAWSRSTYVSVVREHAGLPTLIVNYRWKVHSQASVELRLVPGKAAGDAAPTPLYFVSDFFRGPAKEKIYHSLDLADRGTTASFIKEKTEFKIIGEKNLLGRASIMVLPFNPKSSLDSQDEEAWDRPAIAYPLLDAWAVGDSMLAFDLPREVSYKSEIDKFPRTLKAFSRPGKLHVWFLRGDKVLWENVLDWPGD
jgi:hypothetical protein